MSILVMALFGSAVFGNAFFKYGFGSLTVLNGFIAVCCVTYLTVFVASKEGLIRYETPNRGDNKLWFFFGFGCVVVALSYGGVYSATDITADLLSNSSFIPRQAYYLFFIPLIVLAGRSKSTMSFMVFAKAHARSLFLLVYSLYVLVQGTIALNVPVCFCLATLLLLGNRRDTVVEILLLTLVLFSPIRTGGEMTQMIMRLLLVSFYFFGTNKSLLKVGVIGALCIVLACYVLPFLPLDSLGFDANTAWRAQYWRDELLQLAGSFGIGVGYGTSYATVGFAGSAVSGPFAASADYSVTEKLFVVGCHNSFVSLAFRLGIVGVSVLIVYLKGFSRRDEGYFKGGYAPAASFSVIASIFIVCFNVGFENPTYFFLLAFSIALANSAERISGWIDERKYVNLVRSPVDRRSGLMTKRDINRYGISISSMWPGAEVKEVLTNG